MFKRFALLALVALIALSACSSAPTPAPVTSTNQDTYVSANLDTSYEGALSVRNQLALGTLQLDGTATAITATQAKTLLTLWQALRGTTHSGASAQAEVSALLGQIEGALTADHLHTGELRLDLQRGRAGEPAALLHQERLVLQLDPEDVARRRRGEQDLPRPALRGVRALEQRLAREHGAAQRSEQSPLHLRLEVQVGGHRDHRAGLGADGLVGVQLDLGQREGGAVEDAVLHSRLRVQKELQGPRSSPPLRRWASSQASPAARRLTMPAVNTPKQVRRPTARITPPFRV